MVDKWVTYLLIHTLQLHRWHNQTWRLVLLSNLCLHRKWKIVSIPKPTVRGPVPYTDSPPDDKEENTEANRNDQHHIDSAWNPSVWAGRWGHVWFCKSRKTCRKTAFSKWDIQNPIFQYSTFISKKSVYLLQIFPILFFNNNNMFACECNMFAYVLLWHDMLRNSHVYMCCTLVQHLKSSSTTFLHVVSLQWLVNYNKLTLR